MMRRLQAALFATGAQITARLAAAFSSLAGIRGRRSPLKPLRRSRHKGPGDYPADQVTRLAVDASEEVFRRDFKWFFRRIPESDVGIEARAEILEEGRATGRFMALHIRSETSCVREEEGYLYHGRKEHLDYWTRHSLPVYLLVADMIGKRIVWQRIERPFCRETEAEWSIVVPDANRLDAAARLLFEEAVPTDPEALMRSIFVLDRPLMEDMLDRITVFIWDEWIDPPSTFCNLRIYFKEDRDSGPDMRFDYHLRADSLHEIMTRLFPWASYSYAEPIAEYSEKIAVHVLDVELRPEACAYIDAESFLEAGYPHEKEPAAPEPEDFMTQEEERDFWRKRGVNRAPDDREN
ncbi:DUF4365 domain-containing protein [Neorhizobium petrolearium]|uniref:DUF4365 domain-containing protein n=1 Tax=Neorhizobium petrolearium TaxID=515361 RepID=UPI003F7CDC6E